VSGRIPVCAGSAAGASGGYSLVAWWSWMSCRLVRCGQDSRKWCLSRAMPGSAGPRWPSGSCAGSQAYRSSPSAARWPGPGWPTERSSSSPPIPARRQRTLWPALSCFRAACADPLVAGAGRLAVLSSLPGPLGRGPFGSGPAGATCAAKGRSARADSEALAAELLAIPTFRETFYGRGACGYPDA